MREARGSCRCPGGRLTAVPTRVLNFDSIFSSADLAVLLRDKHGFLPLSAWLAADCASVASELGYGLNAIAVPFGSGTDAAAFAEAGIDATALIGLPTSLFAKGHIYHTMQDTLERIEPEAVDTVFHIAIDCIARNDQALSS